MNAQEKRIARAIESSRKRAVKYGAHRFPEIARVTHTRVRLHRDGTYDYVSGPETHTVGSPRRVRKVWAIRFGVRDGCAYGGFSWETSREAAIEVLLSRPMRERERD